MILDYAKRCEKNMLLSTSFTLVLGFVLLFAPSASIKVITGIIAVIFLFIGILQLIEYFKLSKIEKMMSVSLILGVILLGIGIFLFLNLESLVKFITILIGLVIIIKSLFKLQFSFNIKNLSSKWKYNLITGIVELIIGLILLINPFESAELFLRIIGGVLVIGSIAEMIETLMVMKSLDEFKELPFKEKEKNEE